MLIYRERYDFAYDIIVAFTCLSTKEHVSPTPAGGSMHAPFKCFLQYLWQLSYMTTACYSTLTTFHRFPPCTPPVTPSYDYAVHCAFKYSKFKCPILGISFRMLAD